MATGVGLKVTDRTGENFGDKQEPVARCEQHTEQAVKTQPENDMSESCCIGEGIDEATMSSKSKCQDQTANVPMTEHEQTVMGPPGDVPACIKETSTLEENATDSLPPSSPVFSDLTLDSLPIEIFLHICSFLSAKFVIRTLSVVCRGFYQLISDNTMWKVRIGKRWHKKYPAIPVNDGEFNWKEACIQREDHFRLWSDYKNQMDFFLCKEGLYAAIDAVHLMKGGNLVAAGSRDRFLNVLDLTKLVSGDPESVKNTKVLHRTDAHKGWIWSIASVDDTLATSSWDTYVKLWDLGADAAEISNVKCKSAMLCTHFEHNLLIAGSYDRRVYHIDPRTASIVAEKRYHKQPVLCVVANDNFVVTGSEDKTLVVYDRRADGVLKTINMEKFPMSMSYGRDQLWVGDKQGKIHLLDATDGDFNIVDTYDVGHRCNVTGVIHTLGSIFTCSTDSTIKVLEPSLNPSVITTIKEHKADVAAIDFQNDVLVSACSDVSLGIWRPKHC